MIKLSIENAQKILQYLQKRPYEDVFTLIPMLVNAELLDTESSPEIRDDAGSQGSGKTGKGRTKISK